MTAIFPAALFGQLPSTSSPALSECKSGTVLPNDPNNQPR